MVEVRKINIDFAALGGPVYIGRDRGEAARKKYNLDEIDRDVNCLIVVSVPDSTYSINSSFFLGFFGDSIVRAGSREAFLKKFSFSCPPTIMATIDRCIQRALHQKGFLLPQRNR